jgi:pimeloyl-ACP methyl ester carboxylesterase
MKTLAIFTLTILCYLPYSYGQIQTTLDKRDTTYVSEESIIVSAQTGTLMVPENRQRADSRAISIRFIRLKSLSASARSPLIYLEGGGAPCTWQAEDPEMLTQWIPYLQVSDVILVDQRGTSDEALLYIWTGAYPENFMVHEEAAADHWRKMADTALPEFAKKGVDVTGYTIEESAADIVALTEALDAKRFSILGFSFGTQLGLTLIERYGDKIEQAVLAGAEGLEDSFNYPSVLDQQVLTLSKLVAGDNQLNKQIPHFEQLLSHVMQKLEKNPAAVTIKNPLDGTSMKVNVGAFGLALVLRLDIDDATDIPVLPRLLYNLDHGDLSTLEWFVQKRIVFAFAIPGNGLTQGIAPGASVERIRRIEQEAKASPFGNVVNFPFYHVKPFWPTAQPEKFLKKVDKSQVRTLFLSGDLDCRTPAAQATEIRKDFTNSTHLIVKNAGHEQILSNPDIVNAISIFLKGSDVSQVKASAAPIQFVPLTGSSGLHPSVHD